MLRLRKCDIKFKERKIVVQTAKTHKLRIIDIDIKIAIILYFYCRKLNDNDLLFNFHSSYVSAEFHRRMSNSDLKKITLHDLRHLYASLILSKLQNSANAIIFLQLQLRT